MMATANVQPTDLDLELPPDQWEAFLKILEVVEKRTRRVRALFKNENGHVLGEFTIREQSVEPGVKVAGKVFRDTQLRHDAKWLEEVLSELSSTRLNSAQVSRKLVRSTSDVEEAEFELRALTARALLELARLVAMEGLEVEFGRSGPRRGPVYSFPAIELLAAGCEQFAPPGSNAGADALSDFAEAIWNFRASEQLPGLTWVPVSGTQGDTTVREALAISELVPGMMKLSVSVGAEESSQPLCIHSMGEGPQFCLVVDGADIALARFQGPRAIAALGVSRRLHR